MPKIQVRSVGVDVDGSARESAPPLDPSSAHSLRRGGVLPSEHSLDSLVVDQPLAFGRVNNGKVAHVMILGLAYACSPHRRSQPPPWHVNECDSYVMILVAPLLCTEALSLMLRSPASRPGTSAGRESLRTLRRKGITATATDRAGEGVGCGTVWYPWGGPQGEVRPLPTSSS